MPSYDAARTIRQPEVAQVMLRNRTVGDGLRRYYCGYRQTSPATRTAVEQLGVPLLAANSTN